MYRIPVHFLFLGGETMGNNVTIFIDEETITPEELAAEEDEENG